MKLHEDLITFNELQRESVVDFPAGHMVTYCYPFMVIYYSHKP